MTEPARTDIDRPPSEDDRAVPIDWAVFGVAAALSLLVLAYGWFNTAGFSAAGAAALAWITGNFNWLFVLASGGFVLFSAVLAVSRYGNIKLGPDDSKPEFSTFSWVSMMFATGMGIGLMFYGVAEPLTHLNTPPMDMAEPGTEAAAHLAMEYTFFHWAFHPWAIYAVIGLTIAYFAYRKGYGNLISGTLRPLIGHHATGPGGRAIDMIAILATLFGSATSLGLGALQITGGLAHVFGYETGGNLTLAVGVIAFLTACFVISAVSGVDRGIKWLSNANAIAAALLALFLFVVGPTVFILGVFTESIGGYLAHLPAMSFRTGAMGGNEWLSGWTIFYWAWWISWTPFVGMFIARISRGRTIRQFVIFVILVPSLVSAIWFSIFGGVAIDLQLHRGVDMAARLAEGQESALFNTLSDFPMSTITVALAIFLVAIFFVTGADSASIVMGMLSQNGTPEPKRWLVVFWGAATGAVAAILLYSGGDDPKAGLTALQTGVILIAGPFLLVLIAMCVALWKSLREEPFNATLQPTMRRHMENHISSVVVTKMEDTGAIPIIREDTPRPGADTTS
ncbi:choline/carnitine/betaine transport [Kineosphaera limosa]|uniref:Glycine betaine transporter n=1 Tax=Kineosphaera limosa NBRC 100340 TaxID=1184609 RepID=K6WSK2_9MICO|nr:BCCT family transporter [Kineosphaera limosa]NYE00701.1 choline/carnitine/betaine transport [Kineosphaera limosa]GAB96791.1 glycine betaine transporter [Kineosphaera limosa NBRC 100340]